MNSKMKGEETKLGKLRQERFTFLGRMLKCKPNELVGQLAKFVNPTLWIERCKDSWHLKTWYFICFCTTFFACFYCQRNLCFFRDIRKVPAVGNKVFVLIPDFHFKHWKQRNKAFLLPIPVKWENMFEQGPVLLFWQDTWTWKVASIFWQTALPICKVES